MESIRFIKRCSQRLRAHTVDFFLINKRREMEEVGPENGFWASFSTAQHPSPLLSLPSLMLRSSELSGSTGLPCTPLWSERNGWQASVLSFNFQWPSCVSVCMWDMCMCACLHACVHVQACVRSWVHACLCVCVCEREEEEEEKGKEKGENEYEIEWDPKRSSTRVEFSFWSLDRLWEIWVGNRVLQLNFDSACVIKVNNLLWVLRSRQIRNKTTLVTFN